VSSRIGVAAVRQTKGGGKWLPRHLRQGQVGGEPLQVAGDGALLDDTGLDGDEGEAGGAGGGQQRQHRGQQEELEHCGWSPRIKSEREGASRVSCLQ